MKSTLPRAESSAARMQRRRRCAAACGWLALMCFGCNPEPSAAPAASTSASASATPSPASSDINSARQYLKRPKAAETPSCRVMALEGTLRFAHTDKTLKVGDLVDSEAWLDLSQAGKLSLKHTQTGREWGVKGPAWLRACIEGQEAVWLSLGELSIGTGAGARPGAQVVASTPHGIVLWGDAALSVKVGPKLTTVSVSAGRVWLSPALKTKLVGDTEIGAKESAKLIAEGDAAKRTQLLVAACEEDAAAAERLAGELLSGAKPGPGSSSSAVPSPPTGASTAAEPKKLGLGERARDQAAARGRARGSCAAAWASVGAMDSLAAGKPALDATSAAEPYAARLRKADAAWRRVPFGGAPRPSDKGE